MSWTVLAAARRGIGQPGEAANISSAVVSAAAATANAAPSFGDIIQYTLFHRSASASPVQDPGRSPTGIVTGSLNASTPNGELLSYTVAQGPAHGSVELSQDGTYTYTYGGLAPTGGTDSFRVTIDNGSAYRLDGLGGAIQGIFSALAQVFGLRQPDAITVTVPVGIVINVAPVAGIPLVGSPDSATGLVTGRIIATDPNGDPLTYSGSIASEGTATVGVDGSFTYIPTATARHAAAKDGADDSVTTDTFTVTVTDGYGGSTAIPVLVAIGGQNAAPVAGTPALGTPNASTDVVTGSLSVTDADGDALTYSAPAVTSRGSVVSINPLTGVFTYSPSVAARNAAATTYAPTETFTVAITDGYGGSVAVPVTVAVLPSSAFVRFNFVYGSGAEYFSDAFRNAIQTTANYLASYFVVSSPVTLTYTIAGTRDPNSPNGGAALAWASPGNNWTFPWPEMTPMRTVSEDKIITGNDANGDTADATITFSFNYSWVTGDASNGYSVESTALHEMMHALGITSYLSSTGPGHYTVTTTTTKNGTTTTTTTQTYPLFTVWDTFLTTSNGTRVIPWSDAYLPNLTGGNGGLYFGGPNAVAAYGGLVPIATRNPYRAGSSLSHLDDSTVALLMNLYNNDVWQLSPVELGILKDLGYTVVSQPPLYAVFIAGFSLRRRRRRCF